MEQVLEKSLLRLGVKQGDLLGAAVSGGVDSMALLHGLCALREGMGITVVVYHMEHGIRGEESLRDMRFVQEACEKYGVECIVQHADIPAMAKQRGVSIEMAARDARYAFLETQQARWVATAHHMGDVAETMLLNLARGSGLSGLTGIPEKRGKYIRPMLSFTREEIMQYAHGNGVEYMHDSSNDDVQHTRNYVRHEILPLMARMNPAAEANIVRAASLLKEDEEALRAAAAGADCARETDGEVIIAISKLALQHVAVQRRVVRGALAAKFSLTGFERVHVDSVLALAYKNESGSRASLPGNLEASVVYGKLVIGKAPPKQYNKPLAALPENGQVSCAKYVFDVCRTCEIPAFGAGVEYFDADAAAGAVFRRREQGDMIVPLGMSGRKTLGDYLSDKKVPRRQRDELVVLAKGSQVLWAVGVGVSETSKVARGGGVIKILFWENDDA